MELCIFRLTYFTNVHIIISKKYAVKKLNNIHQFRRIQRAFKNIGTSEVIQKDTQT